MTVSVLEAASAVAKKYQLGFRAEGEKFSIGHERLLTSINGRLIDDGAAYIYLFCRTSSWDLPGERTDANDVFSVLLGAFLRCKQEPFSPTLWDVFNPAVPVPPTEVYARYITLQQPGHSIVTTAESSLHDLSLLCENIVAFERLFPFLFTWQDRDLGRVSFTGEAAEWAERVARILGEPLDDRVQYNQRTSPDWLYYRSIRRRITVLGSSRAVAALEMLIRDEGGDEELNAINRRLYISDRVRSAVTLQAEAYARRILTALNPVERNTISVIPLENRVVVTGGAYAIILSRKCGVHEFRDEVTRVEQRHRKEATVLFRPSKYVWNDVIDDEAFELMIQELIGREPGVLRVRRVGKSRDSDRGKDLVVDWLTSPPAGTLIDERSIPVQLRKVLVQTKASSKSVNKEVVRDIRDTLDDHKASGYFLAVSSQITADLTDHLDRMRTEGRYWTDWWNRLEVESRLSAHPDITARYPEVVQRFD